MVLVRDLKDQRKVFNDGIDAYIKEIQEMCEHPEFFLKVDRALSRRVFDCEICEKHWTVDIERNTP